jgi:hypothetical protein
MDLSVLFNHYKESSLHGRYITIDHIEPLIKQLGKGFKVAVEGDSVQQKPIYSIVVGSGKHRVFMWSQMHGNESTTTKAIFDLLNLLKSNTELSDTLKANFTFYILPMVNPDGAKLYTRENANAIDLNRDAANLSQPESKVLRSSFEAFKPDFCYNMHDQRSIFGVGEGKPATISFLAPSFNQERDINDNRQIAINLIVAMNEMLQQYIPGQVGRFDDGFNNNCVGDTFQSLGVPTVLFEGGHHPNDYFRELTRKYLFFALLSGFDAVQKGLTVVNKSPEYFNIPENRIIFYDLLYKNVKINYENTEKVTNFASHYKEVLFENSVKHEAYITEIGDLAGYYGHVEYDCRGELFTGKDGSHLPKIEQKADFSIGIDKEFVNGVLKN